MKFCITHRGHLYVVTNELELWKLLGWFQMQAAA